MPPKANSNLKNLTIKSNAVKRILKDLAMSDKEIASQKARIQGIKDEIAGGASEKDQHDVRKQEEVLDEYTSGQSDEVTRLEKYYGDLQEILDVSVEWEDIAEIQASDEHSAALENLAAGKAKLLEKGIDVDED